MPTLGAKVGMGVISTKPYGLRVVKVVPQKKTGACYKKKGKRMLVRQYSQWILVKFWSLPSLCPSSSPFHSYLCNFILLIRIEWRDSGNSLLLGPGVSVFFKLDIMLRTASRMVPQPGAGFGLWPPVKGGFLGDLIGPLWQEEMLFFFFFMHKIRTGPN